MRLTIPGGDLQISRTVTAIKDLVEIGRCHRITGSESFVIEAHVVSIRHLESLIDRLSALGATSTSTVLSSPVERREYHARQIRKLRKISLSRSRLHGTVRVWTLGIPQNPMFIACVESMAATLR